MKKSELQTDETRGTARIVVRNERDLRANIRAINQRFNEHPEIARLIFVNPVLALEDIGIELSQPAKEHIVNALRFPRLQRERIARLEEEIQSEFQRRGLTHQLPLTDATRAQLLFTSLRLRPVGPDGDDPSQVPWGRTGEYVKHDPLVAKLAEYERARQGSLIFHPRATYEEFKAGTRQHRWLKAVRFKT